MEYLSFNMWLRTVRTVISHADLLLDTGYATMWREERHRRGPIHVSVRSKLWTREEYERLVAAGAFMPPARIQVSSLLP
jgi:hypothetical protein